MTARTSALAGTSINVRPTIESRTSTGFNWVIQLGLVYVGASVFLVRWIGPHVFSFSTSFVTAIALSAVGLVSAKAIRTDRRYLRWASFLAVWLFVSAVATWNLDTMHKAIAEGFGYVVVVGGISRLVSLERNRHALVFGLAVGSSVFLSVALHRMLTGASVLDINSLGFDQGTLLGINRNAVDMFIVLTLPLLFAARGSRALRILLWPLALASCIWLLSNGGRAGVAAAVVAGATYWLLLPGFGGRARAIVVTLMLVVVVFGVGRSLGAPLNASLNRIRFTSETSASDEIRGLLVKKAWHLTWEHPAFGVGVGRFPGPHPVLDAARTHAIYAIASTTEAQNTYLDVSAAGGIPAAVAFIGIFVVLLAEGRRGSRDRTVRLATAALAGVAFIIAFHTAFSDVLYVPIAMLLGALRRNPVEPRVAQDRVTE